MLQAKLAWLLKRPVFFKGQLLRGEIHSITDQQRVESFARVTEQRARLGELVVSMFKLLSSKAALQQGGGGAAAQVGTSSMISASDEEATPPQLLKETSSGALSC